MSDVAVAATNPLPDSFPSANSDHSRGGAGLLPPPGRSAPEGSSGGSIDGGTRASSAEEEKRDGNGEAAGGGRPSTTVSGSSSVSGGNSTGGHTLIPSFAPLPLTKKGPQSFFSGSKIKHLKKADGIPLWRADIQYEFLHEVFHNNQPVFTNVYDNKKGCCFADIYIDAMARSSKTSKILRDKLLTERENALNMAMVCLLVNVGRMNTTLNFFPEMKAQLRTYHAIPSLQAHTDSNAYKQLQDAPRLKSILKGACEDRQEPQSLEHLMQMRPPRTNPINLVFVLSTFAPKVSEQHFPESLDFYDLVMRTTLSSRSRAQAFLWLMWLYLESDFTEKECLNNPFGRGKPSRDKSMPWCVPDFTYLTEAEAAKENVDTEEEIAFGESKQQERKRLLGELQNGPAAQGRGRGRKSLATAGSPEQSPNVSPGASARKGNRFFEYESDARTRSVSPESQYNTPANGKKRGTNIIKINNILNTEHGSPVETPKNKGGRPKNAKRTYDGELKPLAQRIVLTKGGRPLATPENMQSLDHSSPVLAPTTGPRPRMTSHQIAVQQNRKDRVNHLIERKLQRLDRKKRRQRLKQGAIARAWNRIKDIEDPLLMSDDEERPLKHTAVDMYDEEGNVVKREDDDDHAHPSKRAKLDKSRGALANGNVSRGPAGLIPRREEQMGDEADDFGEEAMAIAAAIRRTKRRLERWQMDEDRRIAQGLSEQQQQMIEEDAEGEDDIAAPNAAAAAAAAAAAPVAQQVEYVSDEDEEEDVNYR